jgi:phage terminase small subunit
MAPRGKDRKLTIKQKLFCKHYLVDLNASQAALKAGYSTKSAPYIGYQLLQKDIIKKEIQRRMDIRAEKFNIDSDTILKEICKLAFIDASKLFDDDGNLIPVHKLPKEVSAAISSIEVVTKNKPGHDGSDVEYTSKIRLWDKKGSLELLGKHLKLFTDKLEASGPGGKNLYPDKIEWVVKSVEDANDKP